jgi:hypothetical protein
LIGLAPTRCCPSSSLCPGMATLCLSDSVYLDQEPGPGAEGSGDRGWGQSGAVLLLCELAPQARKSPMKPRRCATWKLAMTLRSMALFAFVRVLAN